MLLFAVGCLAGGALAVSLAAPFWMPWPMSVRWLVASQAPDAFGGVMGTCPWVAFEEIVVVDVAVAYRRLEVHTVAVVGSARMPGIRLHGDVPPIGTLAALEGWCAAATPLLLWWETGDRAHLYGPDGTVTSLRRTATVPR